MPAAVVASVNLTTDTLSAEAARVPASPPCSRQAAAGQQQDKRNGRQDPKPGHLYHGSLRTGNNGCSCKVRASLIRPRMPLEVGKTDPLGHVILAQELVDHFLPSSLGQPAQGAQAAHQIIMSRQVIRIDTQHRLRRPG